MLEMQ
jgi:hypothetical protein